MTVNREQAEALRKPFPRSAIGRINRGGGVSLDYVGHAAVTQRLLEVDPGWSWEPLALGPDGLPAYDPAGGLWIRLTICGETKLGYGDAQGKKGPNAVKEAIGDAIRNAAMRFGLALDLWAKEDISDTGGRVAHDSTDGAGHPVADGRVMPGQPDADHPAPSADTTRDAAHAARAGNRDAGAMTAAQRGRLFALMGEQRHKDDTPWSDDDQRKWLSWALKRDVESRGSLTAREAAVAIDLLAQNGATS